MMIISHIFEAILREGIDKAGIVKMLLTIPAYSESPDVLDQIRDHIDENEDLYKRSDISDIIKKVNNGVLNKYLGSSYQWPGIKKTILDEDEYNYTHLDKLVFEERDKFASMLIAAYDSYSGRKETARLEGIKEFIANPLQAFINSGLKVVKEGQNCSNADFVWVESLKNKDYAFVIPLTHEACQFIDSKKCGCEGAKWCLGYEKDDVNWQEYITKGHLFILALSLYESDKKDTRKWMIDIKWNHNEAEFVDQTDTKFIKYVDQFGPSIKDILNVFNNSIFKYDNVYTNHILKEVTVTENINDEQFKKKSISFVSIANGVKKIGNRAFEDSGLTEIDMPDSITSIGTEAFWNCSNLEFIRLPKNLDSLGIRAFEYCSSLKEISLPASLFQLCNDTFADCRDLKHVTFEKGFERISYGAFYNCESLESINIPEGTRSIEGVLNGEDDNIFGAFEGCKSLKSISLPSTLKEIRAGAFKDCENLKEIHYNGTKSQWESIEKEDGWNLNTPPNMKIFFNGEL